MEDKWHMLLYGVIYRAKDEVWRKMISVIMLTYNRKEYVNNMIGDILKQSFREFEYIIIDNGSIDGTDKVLDEYVGLDSRIKVITLAEPQPIGKARNIGVQHAAGEYITFVDDDDRLSADYLQYLYGLITEFDAQVAVAGTEEEIEGVVRPQCIFSERECLSGERAVYELLQRKRIRAGTAAKMFQKSIVEKHPFPEDSYHEDIHVTYRFLCEAERVAMGGKPIYRFTRHGGNISFFTSDKQLWTGNELQEYITAFKNREEYVAKRFPQLVDYVCYSTYSYEISMCRELLDDPPKGTKEILEEMSLDLMKNRSRILDYSFLNKLEREYMEKKFDD